MIYVKKLSQALNKKVLALTPEGSQIGYLIEKNNVFFVETKDGVFKILNNNSNSVGIIENKQEEKLIYKSLISVPKQWNELVISLAKQDLKHGNFSPTQANIIQKILDGKPVTKKEIDDAK